MHHYLMTHINVGYIIINICFPSKNVCLDPIIAKSITCHAELGHGLDIENIALTFQALTFCY